jgi:hypothetical protein
MSGEVYDHGHEPGVRKCLPESKELLFRGGESVGEQCDWMRAGVHREELKRRCVPGEGHGLDTHTRLDKV